MEPIHWPGVIRAIVESGVTQPQLAQMVGCGQSTISDLLNAKTTDPRTSIGLALLRISRERSEATGAPAVPEPAAQEAA
jgi:transcriptional regulator with XRE-family HTH domain